MNEIDYKERYYALKKFIEKELIRKREKGMAKETVKRSEVVERYYQKFND